MNESAVLLSSTYFGPVQWYQKLNRFNTVYIERCESFIKQTYRNRCIIATTNGLQALSIPVTHPESDDFSTTSHPILTTCISNHGNWRHIHWNALQSAYGDSPFFDYYVDDLKPFFEERWTSLFSFNMAITEKMCELLDIHSEIRFTNCWDGKDGQDRILAEDGSSIIDYRYTIRPKHPLDDPAFSPKPYYQVYQQKWGFLPNLSILDLLFNMGNESILYL